MALTILFVGGLYAKEANSQGLLDKKFTVKASKIQIEDLLRSVSRQTTIKFSYSSSAIKSNRLVSYTAIEKKVGEFLNEFLSGYGIGYKIVNEQVILFPLKEISINLFNSAISPDAFGGVETIKRIITGRVINDKGEPVSGATVTVKGESISVATDGNGNFSINAGSESVVLLITSVGYKLYELSVPSNNSVVSVVLKADVRDLQDVLVVGYGTQRKRDVTGSVSRIGGEAIRSTPVNSPDQAIQGRVAGVQVMQTSGAPGGAVQVRVRGVNSTAGGGANQPLYVVDGVPLLFVEGINSLSVGNEGSSGGAASNGASPLNTISPNDIESIEVLKDASATAIYGSRAANGVVLITTKSGKSGKPQVGLNVSYGIQSLREKIPVLNARERAAILYEHRRNRGSAGNEVFDVWSVNPYLYPKGTDWQDEVFRNAPIANYNLSVTGGSDKITYSIGGDYMDQQGIVLNTYSKRAGMRVNLDVKATERLKFGTRTNLSYQWENGVATDEFFQGELNYLTVNSPLLPVYDAQGNFAGRPNNVINAGFFGNSNIVANLKERTRRADRYRIISNLFGEYNFGGGLKFRTSLGVDYLFTQLRQVDPYWVRGVDINSPLRVLESSPKTFNWITEQTLTYDKRLGDHTINAVAGFSVQNIRVKTFAAAANGSVSNSLDQLSNNPTFSMISGGQSDQGLVSQFVRTNYAYKGKYLFTGTIRRDGSSRFGANNQYGIFPSFSLGWRLSQENFLMDSKVISDLKLRASYGSTGNQEIGNFLYAALMGGTTAVFGNSYTPGLAPTRFQNEDIQWERNNQFDIGLDLSLYNGRVNITMDYYDKRTKGLLASAPMSVISGVGNSLITNIGEIRNSGFEFALNTNIIEKKNFTWNLDFNIATNKNEVISLGSQPFINGVSVWRINSFINRTEVGQPIGAFYLVQTAGQYQTWQEAATAPTYRISNQPWFGPGDFIPVDQNKDGVIDDQDRVWSGSPFPDYFGGITNTFTYRNWSMAIFAPFQVGNKIWNQPFLNATTFEGNVWREVYDNRWQPSNPGVETSVPIPRNNNPIMAIPFYLQDGSFLRIRTISLGYELPVGRIKFVKLSRMKLYAQANNFFVFTKYKGWDPEVNSFGSNVTTNGLDVGAYPQARSVIFGANIAF
ncbi:TonB-dependent receptor [Flavihumibacter sp. RY-1]|uniref:TonB-dependent receptor n=1 Tax=Flavihumibacter fluminis TaxID=2909236 RepID=A0ABS9BDD3_9BACT|nr:TonB-dependent receptor [Flavihumibacter fluminis]MCF1713714.1 TonB-dependent receptor [Flavihumibacter fluminis]